nr:protein enabled homolog [Dasypus novemcinctus]
MRWDSLPESLGDPTDVWDARARVRDSADRTAARSSHAARRKAPGRPREKLRSPPRPSRPPPSLPCGNRAASPPPPPPPRATACAWCAPGTGFPGRAVTAVSPAVRRAPCCTRFRDLSRFSQGSFLAAGDSDPFNRPEPPHRSNQFDRPSWVKKKRNRNIRMY